MSQTLERGNVSMPADLTAALRERIRETDGPDAAELPLAMLLRYAAARHAGIPAARAMRYGRGLPRGISKRENYSYPNVRDLVA